MTAYASFLYDCDFSVPTSTQIATAVWKDSTHAKCSPPLMINTKYLNFRFTQEQKKILNKIVKNKNEITDLINFNVKDVSRLLQYDFIEPQKFYTIREEYLEEITKYLEAANNDPY